MSCKDCIFSSVRPSKLTHKEKWEMDTRPIPTKWWHYWSSKYKTPDPYLDEEFGRFWYDMDKAIEIDNEFLIYCDRYPTRKTVKKDYRCGEYKAGWCKE